MHPAGIKFGLTHNLLQFRGADVVLSDDLLEHISAAARRQLHGKRIDGTDLLDEVINRGIRKMKLPPLKESRGETTSFFVKIDVIVFNTMYYYAKRAGIGHRKGRKFFFTQEFATELYANKDMLKRAAEEYGYQKTLFLACYDAVVARCKKVTPKDAHHADLLALCMHTAYTAIYMDNFIQKFGRGL